MKMLSLLFILIAGVANAELVTNILSAGANSLETNAVAIKAIRIQNTNGFDVTIRAYDAPSTNTTYTIPVERKHAPGINDAEPDGDQTRSYPSREFTVRSGANWIQPDNKILLKNGLLIVTTNNLRMIYQK